MTEKKSMLLFASAAALTLAVYGSAWSEPPVEGSAAPTATATDTSQPATVGSPVSGSAPKIEQSATTESSPPSPEATPPVASKPGTIASESPSSPQVSKPGKCRCRDHIKNMTPEERRAHREQRFRNMREQAMKRRQEMTERWDSYQKILDTMTPEQKEAVQAVFGRGQKGCGHHRARGRQRPPAMPMQPGRGGPEFGYPAGTGFPGPGYGYGPRGAQPYPSEKNPAVPAAGEQPGAALPQTDESR